MAERMGGEFGRLGGRLSGAARSRAVVDRTVLVRGAVPAPAPPSRASVRMPTAAAPSDDTTYTLLRRSMAENEQMSVEVA